MDLVAPFQHDFDREDLYEAVTGLLEGRPTQAKLVAGLHNRGLTHEAIADQLGISKWVVGRILRSVTTDLKAELHHLGIRSAPRRRPRKAIEPRWISVDIDEIDVADDGRVVFLLIDGENEKVHVRFDTPSLPYGQTITLTQYRLWSRGEPYVDLNDDLEIQTAAA